VRHIIIYKDNGGRLANKLWNFSSIYSFCLEKKYTCQNNSFFRYQHYFKFPSTSTFSKILGNIPFKLAKLIQMGYIFFIENFKTKIIIQSQEEFFLDPTPRTDPAEENVIKQIKESSSSVWYFGGWLFRNPVGLKKYHEQIVSYFTPQENYVIRISNFINSLKKNSTFLVGVHIRQGDYKTWQGGKEFFSAAEVRSILNDFIQNSSKKNITFIICSDEPIDTQVFNGLEYVVGLGGIIEDLYTLARVDLIIGSNSTYGMWASYYGKVPFIFFSRDKINWNTAAKIF